MTPVVARTMADGPVVQMAAAAFAQWLDVLQRCLGRWHMFTAKPAGHSAVQLACNGFVDLVAGVGECAHAGMKIERLRLGSLNAWSVVDSAAIRPWPASSLTSSQTTGFHRPSNQDCLPHAADQRRKPGSPSIWLQPRACAPKDRPWQKERHVWRSLDPVSSTAMRAMKPQSWMAKRIACSSGRWFWSKGALTNTQRSKGGAKVLPAGLALTRVN